MQSLCGKKISAKIQLNKYSRVFLYIKFFLLLSIFLLLVFGIRFDLNNVEPFSAFFIKRAKLVPCLLFILFILLSFFIKRPWCKICPTGQILQFFTISIKGGRNMKVHKVLLVISLIVIIFMSAKINQFSQSNDTLKMIYQRKSVRNYTEEPVSKKDLLTLVKAGMAAPTAMNKQPWAFIVTSEKEKLMEIAKVLPYGKMLEKASAAITVCGIPKESIQGEANSMWIQDCSAATENILLAAEALGLGAVWVGVYPIDENIKNVRNTLGISSDVVPLAVISIGYPKGTEKPKDKWTPSKVHWQKW
jgi:nitroreductase